jgi:minor histocompatibility antigen H13
LIGLFFFDIFWVFGSKLVFKESVMESVATNVDMPLLLKYFYSDNKPIMLGLGDIIIPGLFIKLLVGTDQYIPCLIAYVVSLISAITANNLSGLPQPALLYIVPAVLGTYYFKK